jgi:hypothetical protein
MMDRLDYTLKRETVERVLEDLSYQAYRDNQDLILSGTYNHSGHVIEPDDSTKDPHLQAPTIRAVSIDPNAISDIAPVTAIHPKIPLPEGWELTVSEPIYFRASGYCKGGEAQLRVGDVRYIYTFREPRCEIGGAG